MSLLRDGKFDLENEQDRLTSLVTPAEVIILMRFTVQTGFHVIPMHQLISNCTEQAKSMQLARPRLSFDLPNDGPVELIFDVTGNSTIIQEIIMPDIAIVLTAKDVPSTGVMYYRSQKKLFSQ
jgi:hypothetical protein